MIVQESCKSQKIDKSEAIYPFDSFDEIQLPLPPSLTLSSQKCSISGNLSDVRHTFARANRETVVTTEASTEFFHECVVYREIEPRECLDFINYLPIREQESKLRR